MGDVEVTVVEIVVNIPSYLAIFTSLEHTA